MVVEVAIRYMVQIGSQNDGIRHLIFLLSFLFFIRIIHSHKLVPLISIIFVLRTLVFETIWLAIY